MNQDLLFKIAKCSRIHNVFRPFYAGLGSILMFHRIAKEGRSMRIGKNRRNEISPEFLELLITHLLSRDYEIVSLDGVAEILLDGKRQKKFIAFTFDDGYEDTYSLAYPLFRKYNLPFAVYVSLNYPEKKAVLWWYLLEDLVLRNGRISFHHDNKRYAFPAVTAEQKEAAFHSVRTMIMRKGNDTAELLLRDIFEPNGMDISAYSRTMTLDWNQISLMSEDPLVTIGAHTVNHYALNKLDDEKAEYEIRRSREIIGQHIGKEVRHFSYPFGSKGEAGKREFGMVKSAGFRTATTTRIGNIFPEHRNHLECLPRIPVSGNREDMVSLEALLSGFISAINHSFSRVITQ